MRKLITLILAGAILYFVAQEKLKLDAPRPAAIDKDSKQHESVLNDKEKSQKPKFEGNFLERTASSVLYNMMHTQRGRDVIENIVQPYVDGGRGIKYAMDSSASIDKIMSARTYGQGGRDAATCGHLVTADYTIMEVEDNVIIDEKKSGNWALGLGGNIKGLDASIIGMSAGQTRTTLIPAKYAYSSGIKPKKKNFDTSKDVKLEVTLKHILPKLFIDKDKVKIFDDSITFEDPLMCGDSIKFHAKITDLSNGDVVFNSAGKQNSKPISIKIGQQNYPAIFSHALHGKPKGAGRTVIAQGRYFKGFAAGKTKIFPDKQLPENRYFMLEISQKD